MKHNIKISRLTDYSRLGEVFSLTYHAFLETNLIEPNKEELVDVYPHLNTIKETNITIAEYEGKIVGTISFTEDGTVGLHADNHFKKEVDEIRAENLKVGASWRIAIHKDFRGFSYGISSKLLCSLTLSAEEMKVETMIFVFARVHEKFYKKLFKATTVASLDSVLESEGSQEVDLVLMRCTTEDMNRGLRILARRI